MEQHINVTSKAPYNYWDFYQRMKPNYVAEASLTWDLSKISKITKNRILKWMDQGYAMYRNGDAANIYQHLVKHMGVPRINIPPKVKSEKFSTAITFHNINDEVFEELKSIYAQQRMIAKLEGDKPWLFRYEYSHEELQRDTYRVAVNSPTDTTQLEKLVTKMVATDEYKQKIEAVKKLVTDGAKITFKP